MDESNIYFNEINTYPNEYDYSDDYLDDHNYGFWVLILIPILGAIKNIVKRKTFYIFIFMRTFGVYLGIYLVLRLLFGYTFEFDLFDCMGLSLAERYCMFVYKIIYSYVTKNYEKKKYKYYQKYINEYSTGSLKQMYGLGLGLGMESELETNSTNNLEYNSNTNYKSHMD